MPKEISFDSGKDSRRPVRVGAIGELLVEFVAAQKDTRHLRPADYRGPFPSGAPGIFIDQAARAGAEAIFAGAVGADAFGAVIRERLSSAGVDDRLIRTAEGIPTGSAFVAYNSDGSRDFVFNIAHSAAARLPEAEECVAVLEAFGVDVFHISGSALADPAMRTTALAVCRALAERGAAISLDPNIRKELLGESGYLDALWELMELAAYVLPSDADAEVLFPGETFAAYADRLLSAGKHAVVLKRGEEGCIGVARGGEMVSIPAHRVRMVDPTGAGDCFCATFVTHFAGGRSLSDALAYANAAGALAVGKIGPMEGNSSLGEIQALLEAST
ncbi:sugar kinase [Chelativorans sp. AA-79]|uniref:sugar kinase n=1 Tax=Chelativorans sp. AA-79 TaxID=3028735 RepID=UPI0023F8137B|nr:sugar kinase [Chelativorans sp. AA-79]WEX10609.1 sugar kinase [Chelativorans sp. AA-79]